MLPAVLPAVPRAARPVLTLGAAAAGVVIVGLTAGQVVPTGAVAAEPVSPSPTSAATSSPSPSRAPDARSPRPLGVEGFEQGALADPVFLEDYVGAGGARYTAHVDWLDPTRCNGAVVRFDAPDQAHCAAVSASAAIAQRALAHGLGQLDGAVDPGRNHAVASRTEGRPVRAGQVQLESVGSLATGVDGRFLTVGVDVGVLSCRSNRPALTFAVTRGTAEMPVSSTEVDPCVGDVETFRAPDGGDVVAGHHLGDEAVLAGPGVYGAQVRNHRADFVGNDLALDDLGVFDVTPELSMAFAADEAVEGVPTELVHTITNTTEAGAKRGWSFDQALPAGLDLAGPVGGTCDVVSTPTESGLHLVGDLAAGGSSCTVVVPVVADAAGRYEMTGENVTGLRGLDGPGRASFVVVPPKPADIGVVVTPRSNGIVLGTDGRVVVGDVVDYTATVTNTGGREVTGLTVEHALGDEGAHALSCDTTTLDVGASTDCTLPESASWQVDQSVFDVGLATGAGHIRAASSSGELVRTVSTEVVAAEAAPDFSADGTALFVDRDGVAGVGPDDAVDVELELVNTGNVTVDLSDVFVPPTQVESASRRAVARRATTAP